MNTKVMTLIKRITLIVLGVALLVSAGLVFLTSYTSWNDYYKQMLIKKERFDKEQEPEVTVMNGIRVSIKDGVGFFKNGKASADKANFIVEGLYTIGNEVTKRDYEYYDLLLVMDSDNIRNLRRVIGEDTQDKVHFLLDYTGRKGESIADPWYTGDFDVTYNDIMEGLEGLDRKSVV